MNTGRFNRLRFAHMVEGQRKTILLLMALVVIAVFVDIHWQEAVPAASPWDLVVQIGMGLLFVGLLAWELLDTTNFIQRAMVAAIAVGTVGTVTRLYLWVFGPAWQGAADLSLPTSLGYLPVITLSLFSFLPRRDAVLLGTIIIALTGVPIFVYLLTHLDQMRYSPRLVDLCHSVLLINPIAFLLGLVISRVHLHMDELSADDRMAVRTSTADTDFETLTFNRGGITRALQESVAKARSSGNELTIAMLGIDTASLNCAESGSREQCLRRIAEAIKDHFPAATTTLGRLARGRFVLILQRQTIGPTTELCSGLLDELNRRFSDGHRRIAHAGLALYQPGETVTRLMRRAEEQLERATANGASGIAFNADEAL